MTMTANGVFLLVSRSKAVRGAEIGSDHYLMKIKLKVGNVKKSRQEWVRQQIKVGKLKDDKVRREYQAAIAELLRKLELEGVHQEWMWN